MGTAEGDELAKRLRFRSYEPTDEKLKKYWVGRRDVEQEVVAVVEAEERRTQAAVGKFHDDAFMKANLVPKKANWDLKRNIAPKLAKLERQTKFALFEIAQQRAAENTGDDFDLSRVVRDAEPADELLDD